MRESEARGGWLGTWPCGWQDVLCARVCVGCTRGVDCVPLAEGGWVGQRVQCAVLINGGGPGMRVEKGARRGWKDGEDSDPGATRS
jgi:hypothetical protein